MLPLALDHSRDYQSYVSICVTSMRQFIKADLVINLIPTRLGARSTSDGTHNFSAAPLAIDGSKLVHFSSQEERL